MQKDYSEQALEYHSKSPAGKIGIALTKECNTQDDLSVSYTPGVGSPCMEIHKDENNAWKYTNKGNTVAVITDGTAVLGLGNIGSLAGLPVMEGKCVLFKKFADVDAYPLCLKFDKDIDDPAYIDDFCDTVAALQPSLGGINLEDIKGPQCFEVLSRLMERCDIPVFHDDQDGTGIIISAGVLNSLKLVGKNIEEVKIVVNGAGAAGIACARLLLSFGVKRGHIFMCDSKGLITTNREVNKYKVEFAQDHPEADLAEVIKGADVFIGVSFRDVLKPEMVKTMNKDAIIFAVANPIPEIMPELALEAGARVVGTGRSDYPNQVNNSLGFPGLFRAALDTRATTINQEMKAAASKALASLIFEPASDEILDILSTAYPEEASRGVFTSENPLSENYVIPKQFDLRVVPRVARVVAEAAMQSGVAKNIIDDLDKYEQEVLDRVKKNWM